jgi:hypothetical protein
MWRRKELFLSSSVTAQRLKRRELSVLHPEVLKEEKFLPVWAGITTILIAGTLYLYKKGKVNFLSFSLSLTVSSCLSLCLYLSLSVSLFVSLSLSRLSLDSSPLSGGQTINQ